MKVLIIVQVLVAACAAQRGYSSLDEEIFSLEDIQPFARTRSVRQGYGSGGHQPVVVVPKPPQVQSYVPSYGGGSSQGNNGPVSFGGGSGGWSSYGGGSYGSQPVAPHRNPHQISGGGYGNPQKPHTGTGGGYGPGPSIPVQIKPVQSGYGSPTHVSSGGSGYGSPTHVSSGGSGYGSPTHASSGGSGYGSPTHVSSGGSGYGSGALVKPISSGGYGGPSVPTKPQTGGPGYGSPPPVVEIHKNDQHGDSGYGGSVSKPHGPGYGSPEVPVVDSYSKPPVVEQGYGVPEKVPSSTGPIGYGR